MQQLSLITRPQSLTLGAEVDLDEIGLAEVGGVGVERAELEELFRFLFFGSGESVFLSLEASFEDALRTCRRRAVSAILIRSSVYTPLRINKINFLPLEGRPGPLWTCFKCGISVQYDM